VEHATFRYYHGHTTLKECRVLIIIINVIINVKIIVTLLQKNAAGALYKTLCQNLQLTLCNKYIAQSCPVFKGCLE